MRWDDLIPSHSMEANYLSGAEYDDFIEHDGASAQSLQALASDLLSMTPKQERDPLQAYTHIKYDSYTPPLSPSTTISSLLTEEHYSSDESVNREEVKRGKQPLAPTPEERIPEDQEDDWYGMEYALEQSRYEYPGSVGVWPPTTGESSTSDAAFVAMYDGYIYPEDVSYWQVPNHSFCPLINNPDRYEHWCKWHRALAREEKRRRDRAASDAKHTRAYDHATYVEWERSQNKKASGSSKPATTRHRSSTCLF